MTIRQIQAALDHLLQHEGATPDTRVVFFADKDFLADPEGCSVAGPDGGRLLQLSIGDQLSGPSWTRYAVADRDREFD